MLDKSQNLTVSCEELAVIEDALHTQHQILNVQANAGGDDARTRLNAVKSVLARLAQQKPAATGKSVSVPNATGGFFAWISGRRSACQ